MSASINFNIIKANTRPGSSFNSDNMLVAALIKLDNEIFLHSKRTQTLALSLGKQMGLSSQELSLLELGALLHDIGKHCIPSAILNKPTKLSVEEWELIKTHPIQGYHYIKPMALDDIVKRIVLNHHRWANGEGGYPLLNNCNEPCFLTQIVTVADAADAITSNRPYRPALNVAYCIDYLDSNTGTIFNRDIVTAFKRIATKTEEVNKCLQPV